MRGPKRIYWVHLGPYTRPEGGPTYGLRYAERGGGIYTQRDAAIDKIQRLRKRGYLEADLFTAEIAWEPAFWED